MLHVVLVEPEIPPNTGNIARLCLAAGARLHLVEPLGFSLEEKALRRAGMDYWDRCDVRKWQSFEVLRQQSGGARFLFLTKKAKRPYWDGSIRARRSSRFWARNQGPARESARRECGALPDNSHAAGGPKPESCDRSRYCAL